MALPLPGIVRELEYKRQWTPERIGISGSFGIWRLNDQIIVGDGLGNDLVMLPQQVGEVIALLDMARQELGLEP